MNKINIIKLITASLEVLIFQYLLHALKILRVYRVTFINKYLELKGCGFSKLEFSTVTTTNTI